MFQNMKVDVIYYKTNTDFEMEFNLCGCCRMRLLTDKTPDRKTMVHSLARAVSRSKIIIIVGSLFGDSGSITSVAEAIGSKLTVTNNKTYGIKSDDEINIISGSTPLVSNDGIFGGCIIESGPQTMILLSDNKAVRKNIMQSLIHPYIEELYANELKERVAHANNSITDAVPESAETEDEFVLDSDILDAEETTETDVELSTQIVTDDEETESEGSEEELSTEYVTHDENSEFEENEEDDNLHTEFVTEPSTENNEEPITHEDPNLLSEISEPDDADDEEIVVSTGMVFNVDDTSSSSDEPYIEPDMPKILVEENEGIEIPDITELIETDERDKDYLSEDESPIEIKKGFSLNLPILILTVLLLLTIAILCYCIFFIPSQNGTTAVQFVKETFNTLLG